MVLGFFAIVSKIHHCMIDGIAGVDLMAVLLSLAPSDEVEDPVPGDGEVRVRVDGDVRDLDEEFDLTKNKRHTIDIVVDRLDALPADAFERLLAETG